MLRTAAALLLLGTVACDSVGVEPPKCAPGRADCNNLEADACETVLAEDPRNCGRCGNLCGLPNAVASCRSGACAVGSCASGFSDCNARPDDGCEVDLQNDASNCGRCGNRCGADAVCTEGRCWNPAGRYRLEDAPSWASNPPVRSCLEACSALFGGDAVEYACSTLPGEVDHRASTAMYAVKGCIVASETTKVGERYYCRSQGCAQSAHVQDDCKATNFCFR